MRKPFYQSPILEPAWAKWLLISIALSFLGLFIMLPTIIIFFEALHKGVHLYLATFHDRNALLAIRLTVIVALVSVIFNLVFGLAASWAMTKFRFKGKEILLTLIDLPFSVSPIIGGLIYVMLFGAQSLLGKWLLSHDVKIIYALPGMIIATMFITLPFIARELIPLMEKLGTEEEEVATLLGAHGLQTFWRVTIPSIKWGLLYGILLCNARAMGEFGAVSVVSGHIRGATTTLPLYVEIFYNEFNYISAFAMASILTLLALITLVLKAILETKKL